MTPSPKYDWKYTLHTRRPPADNNRKGVLCMYIVVLNNLLLDPDHTLSSYLAECIVSQSANSLHCKDRQPQHSLSLLHNHTIRVLHNCCTACIDTARQAPIARSRGAAPVQSGTHLQPGLPPGHSRDHAACHGAASAAVQCLESLLSAVGGRLAGAPPLL